MKYRHDLQRLNPQQRVIVNNRDEENERLKKEREKCEQEKQTKK